MSQSGEILFVTTDGGTLSSIADIGVAGTTISGSPTVVSTGQPVSGIASYRGIAINLASNNYFVTVLTDPGSSEISTVYRETFGVAPSFTTSTQVGTATDASYIMTNIAVDSTNNILYYADGTSLYADHFANGFNSAPTALVKIGTLPLGVTSLTFDQADSTIYAGGATSTGSGGVHASSDSLTLKSNYIYKITGVTANMGTNSATIATTNVPQSDGGVSGVTYDSANSTLYFTTNAYLNPGTASVAGVFKINAAGVPVKVWDESFSSFPFTDPLADITGITIDPSTGDYYLTTDEDDIYTGNVSSSSAPVAMLNTAHLTSSSGDALPTAVVFVPIPPTLTLSGTSIDAVQGGAGLTLLSAAPVITAPDGSLASASVTLSGFQSGDVLGINGSTSGTLDSGKITYSAANGTLSLSGTDSVSAYEAALGEVTYQDTGTDSSSGAHPTRSVNWEIGDGVLSATPKTSVITVDRPPSIVSGGVHTSMVAGGVVTGAALTGDTDLDGDSLTITSIAGGAVGSSVAGTYGNLTLNGNGSYSYSANNSAAISSAATGTKPVDQFTFTVSDGKGGSSTESLSITIDRNPIIASGGSQAAVLAGGSTTGGALAGDTDPDGDSLTITAISGGVLGSAISGSYGVLTLNANGSYSYSANNSAALAAAATGSKPVDHFSYTVSDGNGGAATETLSISIDRNPVVAAGGAQAALVAGGVVTGAALTGDSDPDGDSLTITSIAGGAVGSSVAGTYGHLTLNGNGSYSYSADNSAAIDSAATGSSPVDQFTFTVADGNGGTATETLSIEVSRLPSFAGGTPGTYTPGGAAVSADATGTISDPDGTQITGAVIYLTSGNLPGDLLSFTPQSGITGSFTNGTLTLAGTASAADYQAALQSVQYSSTDADPYGNGANPSRTIGVILTDAAGSGQPGSLMIAIDPSIDIGASSLVSLGAIDSGRGIDFLGTGATLDLTSPGNFAGTITDFGGNTIDLAGLNAAAETFSAGTLSLYDGLGGLLDTLSLTEPAGITSADFHLASDGTGGTDLTLCFYPGTFIATPGGETTVEDLRPGDMLLTRDGPALLHWVGRSEVDTRFAGRLRSLPIRISAGALGAGLPRRDLLLSPDHALLLGNVLVQAAALINGGSIRREYDVPERFTYYHLELAHHALLLAEGALAESFVDNVDRMHFHNWDERDAAATPIAEMPYPRAKSARQVPAALRRQLGFPEAA